MFQSNLRQPSLGLLYLVVFIDLLGVGLIMPLVATVSKSVQMSALVFGFISSAYAFTQFLFNPVMGQLSDTYGRKRVFLVSLAGTAVSYLLLGTATTAWAVFISRMIVGVVKQTVTLARACVTDSCEGNDRATAFGNIMISVSLAFVVGPAISSLLGQTISTYCSVSMFIVDFFIVLFYFPDDAPKNETVFFTKTKDKITKTIWKALVKQYNDAKEVYKRPHASGLLNGRLVQSLVTSIKRATYSLIVLDVFGLSPGDLGYVISYHGVVGVVAGLAMHFLNKRSGKYTRYWASTLILTVATFFTAYATTTYEFLLTVPLLSFSTTVLTTVCITEFADRFEGGQQGLAMGVWGSFDSIGGVVGPLVGGTLYQYGGIWSVYVGAAILSGFTFFISKAALVSEHLVTIPLDE